MGYEKPVDNIAVDNDGYLYIVTYFNDLYISSESTILDIISTTTGLSDISVYPNPVVDKVNVEYNLPNYRGGSVLFQIYNIFGVKIREMYLPYTEGIKNYAEIDFYDMPQGFYFLQVPEYNINIKIIKK